MATKSAKSSKKYSFIPCSGPLPLPSGVVTELEAAATAVTINPNNQVRLDNLPGMLSALVAEPMSIAVLTTRYHGSGGVKLGVSFLDNTVAALRDKIIEHMNSWSEFSNVKFMYSQSGGQVRISRGPGGYWSYLGTDIYHIAAGQPTMNLQGFSLNTPESEYRRVVRHETGHTLGFPHEHMRREIVDLIDVQKAIAYFGQTQGWSASMVKSQVLTPLEESSIMGTEHADSQSIMCYQLPGSITKNGQPIAGGNDIDASDRAFVAKIYPLSTVLPPAPTDAGVPFAFDFTKKKLTMPAGWTAQPQGN